MPEQEDPCNDDTVSEQINPPKLRQPTPRRPEYANRNQEWPQYRPFVFDDEDDED